MPDNLKVQKKTETRAEETERQRIGQENKEEIEKEKLKEELNSC